MPTQRTTLPSPAARIAGLACALWACQADPASTGEAPYARVPTPDARVDTPDARIEPPDAAPAPLLWTRVQYRVMPNFFAPWSETFFQGQGEPAVEVEPTGEFFAVFRAIPAPGTRFDPGRLVRGTLDPASTETLFAALTAAGPLLRASGRYMCNLCGGECNFRGLTLVTAEGTYQSIGDESFGPDCDPEYNTVPPALTPLAVALHAIIVAARDGALALTAVDPPPRVRLGVAEARAGFPTNPRAADLDAASPWPFEAPALAEVAQGKQIYSWWWEASLTGDAAASVWAHCAAQMAVGTMEFGPGPFLAREGDTVYAVACAPALPGEPWVY